MVSEAELSRALSTEEKMTVVAIQAYVSSGIAHTGTRYRCEAALDNTAQQRRLGLGVVKLCYLGAAGGGRQTPHPRAASGGPSTPAGPAFVLKSAMTSFNGQLQQATKE
eukprot:3026850-Prymnesium_polylepis.1